MSVALLSRVKDLSCFNEKKMNKILQNVFFKNKKKEERKKCILSWMRCTEEDYY